MLLPVGVVHPDAVGLFEVLLLQGIEELVHQVLFVARSGRFHHTIAEDDHRTGNGGDAHPLLARTRRIVGLGFEQRHGDSSLLVEAMRAIREVA